MQEILDNFEPQANKNYRFANKNKRLINYIIDSIVHVILAALGGFVWGMLLYASEGEAMFEADTSTPLLDYLLGFLILVTYYTLTEYFFKGRTLGKLITKTRAVTLDNKRMDFQTTLIRSLCRLIPFEVFSYLGEKPTGWHDNLSKTKVIEDIDWYEE